MNVKEGMMMPTSQETMTNAAHRSQEALSWTQKYWDAKLHDVDQFVDKTFDFYYHVLGWEREFIKNWLSIIRRVDHKVVHMAHEAVKETTPERGSYEGDTDYDRDKDMAAKRN